jgi:hypothetical protein
MLHGIYSRHPDSIDGLRWDLPKYVGQRTKSQTINFFTSYGGCMNIQGKIVTLRAIEMSDLTQLNEWSNAPELWNMLGGWHFPYSLQSTDSNYR